MAVKLERGESPTVTFEIDHKRFPGWEVDIAYVQPSRLAHLTEKATVTERSRGRVERNVDNEKFVRLLAPEMIKGWRGLKPEYVLEMVPLSDGSKEALEAEGELEFSESALIFLVENAYSRDFFDQALNLSTDLALLKDAQKKADLGN